MRTLESLQMDGGCLVFNFVNTVNTRKPAPEFEYLKTYDALLTWSAKAGFSDEKKLASLREYAAQEPEAASAELHDAIAAREVLYELFSAIAANRAPESAVTAAFNERLSKALQTVHIRFGPAGAEIRLGSEKVTLNEPLLPVLKSAFDVLTREDFGRIKECPRCGWLFLDTSKNGKRKWCDMNVCGAREKSLEYYYRKTRQKV